VQKIRFVAIGDSFTEGVGDAHPDGRTRGWADLVAQGWADAGGEPIDYANLAIRGKLVWPIVNEQLERALALSPTHLSFNGGGNDVLRPRTKVAHIVDAFEQVLRRCDEEGVQLILLSGANPAQQLPMRGMIQRRGDLLSDAVEESFVGRDDVIRAFNWPDRELSTPGYWSEDRLHMNSRGHHRVAARVLGAIGHDPDPGWWSMPPLPASGPRGWQYYREHVGPWMVRRIRRTSSGDGLEPKYGTWRRMEPGGAGE